MSSLRRLNPIRVALLVSLVVSVVHLRWSVAELANTDELLHAVTTGTEGARMRAAERLYQSGDADRAVPRVARGLRQEDPDERCLAARILGMLRSARAVAPLAAALNDDDWAVRRDVAEALGQIRAPAAVSHLNSRIGDQHPRVRIAVIRALAELGARAALPQALARETEPEVRLHLVEALGSATNAESRRALERALQDDTESVRLLAASFLVERGNGAAVSLLGERLADGSTVTARREAAEALGRSGGAATATASRVLVQALVDPSIDVALAAAASLVALGDHRGREFLRSIADGENAPELRARALEMLEEAGGRRPEAGGD